MAEYVPRDCCVTGVKHEGTAQGEMKMVAESANRDSPVFQLVSLLKQPTAETYLSYPTNGNTQKAVLFLTDVIGHGFINAQL